MSERGSFVTEYIYCPKCLEAAKRVLLDRDKGLCSQLIQSWDDDPEKPYLPIIAGKLGGSYSGEELHVMECELGPELVPLLCHSLRIAVICETFPNSGIVLLDCNSHNPVRIIAGVDDAHPPQWIADEVDIKANREAWLQACTDVLTLMKKYPCSLGAPCSVADMKIWWFWDRLSALKRTWIDGTSCRVMNFNEEPALERMSDEDQQVYRRACAVFRYDPDRPWRFTH
jgi:hypothetical protein